MLESRCLFGLYLKMEQSHASTLISPSWGLLEKREKQDTSLLLRDPSQLPTLLMTPCICPFSHGNFIYAKNQKKEKDDFKTLII